MLHFQQNLVMKVQELEVSFAGFNFLTEHGIDGT